MKDSFKALTPRAGIIGTIIMIIIAIALMAFALYLGPETGNEDVAIPANECAYTEITE